MKKVIDTEKWYRSQAYDFFKGFADPFFNMAANVEITSLRRLVKGEKLSFTPALMYYSQKAANSIPEFRTRIDGAEIVEFEHVESTQTLLQDDESFSFTYYPKAGTLREFCVKAKESLAHYKELNTFEVERDRLDLIYYSVIPWISFTSFKHASTLDPSQSSPRIVFGKYFEEGGKTKIPISVEGNHIVMDGIHVGKYFERITELLNNCSIDD